jgi:hypothetical protein
LGKPPKPSREATQAFKHTLEEQCCDCQAYRRLFSEHKSIIGREVYILDVVCQLFLSTLLYATKICQVDVIMWQLWALSHQMSGPNRGMISLREYRKEDEKQRINL